MKRLYPAIISLLIALPVWAEAPAPSDESIKQLMTAAQTQKQLDNILTQIEMNMQASMKQAMANKSLDAEQQKVVDEMQKKIMAAIKEEMTWSKFEPMMIDIYRKNFTEPEVKGMLEFYGTDAGKALINKMPLVIQSSMDAARTRMNGLGPKIQQIQQDAMKQLKPAAEKAEKTEKAEKKAPAKK